LSQQADTKALLNRIAELEKTDTGTPLSDFSMSIPDKIVLGAASIRRNIAYAIMGLFVVVNLATLYFVYRLFQFDQGNLASKLAGPGERVVSSPVVMTLLGATTVQLGTVMVIMARFVFRPPVDHETA
jgi:hypothetical protein